MNETTIRAPRPKSYREIIDAQGGEVVQTNIDPADLAAAVDKLPPGTYKVRTYHDRSLTVKQETRKTINYGN